MDEVQGAFQLFPEIMKLSEATEWEDVALEWKLVWIQWDKEGDHCICGHFIKEKCFIRNVVNNNRAVVGNCCIKKFRGRDLTSVFRALSRGKINPALISYAFEGSIIDAWEEKFMLNFWRKRELSWAERNRFNIIRQKIYDACKMEVENLVGSQIRTKSG